MRHWKMAGPLTALSVLVAAPASAGPESGYDIVRRFVPRLPPGIPKSCAPTVRAEFEAEDKRNPALQIRLSDYMEYCVTPRYTTARLLRELKSSGFAIRVIREDRAFPASEVEYAARIKPPKFKLFWAEYRLVIGSTRGKLDNVHGYIFRETL